MFEMQAHGVVPGEAKDSQTAQVEPPLNVTLATLPTTAPLPAWRRWLKHLGRS
ncbi:hypothetical protein [Azospirillum endophyticum]